MTKIDMTFKAKLTVCLLLNELNSALVDGRVTVWKETGFLGGFMEQRYLPPWQPICIKSEMREK